MTNLDKTPKTRVGGSQFRDPSETFEVLHLVLTNEGHGAYSVDILDRDFSVFHSPGDVAHSVSGLGLQQALHRAGVAIAERIGQ